MPIQSILYVGTRGGTCEQRARALEELGKSVTRIESEQPPRRDLRFPFYAVGNRFGRPPDVYGTNRKIRRAVAGGHYDALWVDKGRSLRPGTLRFVRQRSPETRLLMYSPDDMFYPRNYTPLWGRSIPLYDLHVTTKSFNIDQHYQAGARRVLLLDKAYDPETHRPLELSEAERRRFATEVGFVGVFEPERLELLHGLAEAGLQVSACGGDWDRAPLGHPRLRLSSERLHGLDYARAINAARINLGLLSKPKRDRQTARSVEIPACGGFMLGDRSDEHLRLFEEGVEAEFFSDFGECLAKCRFYLEHEEERRKIAEAGLRRCRSSGYDVHSRLVRILDELEGS